MAKRCKTECWLLLAVGLALSGCLVQELDAETRSSPPRKTVWSLYP